MYESTCQTRFTGLARVICGEEVRWGRRRSDDDDDDAAAAAYTHTTYIYLYMHL